MCGIAGIFRSGNSPLVAPEMAAFVEAMTSSMAHRGPDASGLWSDPSGRCVLGHRRLSIIDTSDAGRQPMATSDGRWMITFNGEIYNFQEVKPALEAAGVRLRGRTDTEVLIESIALWGTDALTRLDGMFAFAAFNLQSGELLLARDAFGEKPLYYMDLPGGGFAFASELQALERLPGFDGTVAIDALAEVLSFQYIGAPRSIYRAVRKLPPAHWLRIDSAGKITTGRYFQFKPGLSGFTDRPMNDLADELEEILTRSIRRRLIADVPLGAFLSGGVDSSTVCALIRKKLGLPLMTFSTGFGGAPESEHLTARAFAEHLGTDHHEEILTPDAADFLLHIGEILDEPNGDSSCMPTYLLSRFARQSVTVAVSGDGGDEMFGGYGRYFATLDESARHRAGELPGWTPGGVYFGNRILVATEDHLTDLLGYVPEGLARHLSRLRRELDSRQGRLLCEMRRTDVDNYMPGAVLSKVDRMSMRHSLEVRTPFLSTELARFAERLPDSVLVQNGRGKQVLREVAYRHLPRHLIDLPKQGFGLPLSDWARTSLLEVTGKLIESDDSRLLSAFGAQGIGRFMTRQRTPGQFSPYQVWAVAMLESWLRHHPAKLPEFSDRRPQRRVESEFVAAPVGENTYLAFRHSAAETPQAEIDNIFRFLSSVLPTKTRNAEISTALTTIRLPEWGTPLTDDDTQRLIGLRGSTLLCPGKETSLRFDFDEYSKLQTLGVKRLVFPDPFVDAEPGSIEIHSMTLIERLWSLFRLMPQIAGIVSNQGWARILSATSFRTSEEGINEALRMRRIGRRRNTDLSKSFMLFEGARQLPPVQVTHGDIGSKGNGRYSIWNQGIYFSPTETERLHKRPYWVVPFNEKTEPFLPMVPRSARRTSDDEQGSMIQVKQQLASAEIADFVLNPGDPVAVCTHSLAPGGAERQWVYLAQSLKQAGYDVTVVVYNFLAGDDAHYLPVLEQAKIRILDASRIPLIEQIGVYVRFAGASALLASNCVPEHSKLARLAAAFVQCAPKVVFAQLDEPNILAGFAAHLAGVQRVVLSFRNYNPTNFPYIDKAWYREAYRLLSTSGKVLFSGNHRDANRDYANWIGISPGRVTHIPNVIDREMFPVPTDDDLAFACSELGLSAGAPMVLGAFRLSIEKDPLTFIDVCAQVAKELPALRVFLVGIGPMQGEIEERISMLGLEKNVTLLGRRSDINVLMTLASIFLLTSTKEGMPNVLMEAQLMGTPIVATRTAGTADTVTEGQTALLRDVGDIEGLASGCLQLLREPPRAARMGDAGRRRATTSFSRALLCQRYLDLLCDRQGSGGSDLGRKVPSLNLADAEAT